jgi:hypothetical protein
MARLNIEQSRMDENFYSGGRHTRVKVPDAATYTVLAKDSGKVHLMPNMTADVTDIRLPTPKYGLFYRFEYVGVAADAQDWLFKTGSDTNYFLGGVIHIDTDAGAGTDEIVPVYPDGNSNSMLDFDTPQVGTWVEFWCDGTLWYVQGHMVGVTAPTFADHS